MSEEVLQRAGKRREVKGKGERKYRVPENNQERQAFLNEKYKEIGETMGETGEGDGTPL